MFNPDKALRNSFYRPLRSSSPCDRLFSRFFSLREAAYGFSGVFDLVGHGAGQQAVMPGGLVDRVHHVAGAADPRNPGAQLPEWYGDVLRQHVTT